MNKKYQMNVKVGDVVLMPDRRIVGIVRSVDIFLGGNTKKVVVFPHVNWLHRFLLARRSKHIFYDESINRLKVINSVADYEKKQQTKPSLQALLIAPDHDARTSILDGVTSITIREGYRDYKPGPAMLCCHIVPWAVMCEITNVRHCLLREVTAEEYEAYGVLNQESLLLKLQKFYLNINLDSPMTVIRWKNVQGFLADHAAEYRMRPSKLYGEIKQ